MTSLLNNANGELSVEHLIENYAISERTLKNEVKNINEFLFDNGCGASVILENKKIKISEGIDRREVFRAIAAEERRSYILLPEEREELLMVFLIKARDYITLNDLANRLNVSRLTIANDISTLKEKIEPRGVTVKSCKGKGLTLECSEIGLRKILADILKRNFQGRMESGGNAFQRLLTEALDFKFSLREISKQISIFETTFHSKCSDEEHDRIAIFMFISFNRIAAGFTAEPEEPGEDTARTAVGMLYLWLSDRLGLLPVEAEHQQAEKFGNSLERMRSSLIKANDPQKNQTFVFDFILRLSDELEIQLYQDKRLMEGLMNHFAERRGKAGSVGWTDENLQRPRRNGLKEIFSAVEKILEELAASYQLSITAKDVQYISAYVISAIERLISLKGNLRILVVCTTGVAVSQLLASEIQKYFAFDIQGTCSVREIYQYAESHSIDFIISTVNLYNVSIPFVVVSPLLNQEDINKIYDISYSAIKGRAKKDRWQNEIDETFLALKKIMKEQADGSRAESLRQELKKLAEQYGVEPSERKSDLSRVFKARYVQRAERCRDWEEAVRLAARPLLDDGMITEEYIQAIVENCRENGPYFVLREGLAAAHAAPDRGILKPCFSLLYIRDGVDFHHELFGKVQFLFCLCFQESGDFNLQVLNSLINFIGDANAVQQVENAEGDEEIYRTVYQYIESYSM